MGSGEETPPFVWPNPYPVAQRSVTRSLSEESVQMASRLSQTVNSLGQAACLPYLLGLPCPSLLAMSTCLVHGGAFEMFSVSRSGRQGCKCCQNVRTWGCGSVLSCFLIDPQALTVMIPPLLARALGDLSFLHQIIT